MFEARYIQSEHANLKSCRGYSWDCSVSIATTTYKFKFRWLFTLSSFS
jgi:hypothetical protein